MRARPACPLDLNFPPFDGPGCEFGFPFLLLAGKLSGEVVTLKFRHRVAKDGFQVADRTMKDANPMIEPLQDTLLDSATDHKVVNHHNLG